MLRESQQKMGVPMLNMLRPSGTRWIGYEEPMQRLNQQWTAVVDQTTVAIASSDTNADTKKASARVLNCLTDLTVFLAVLAVLPFMRTLKVLILQLQSNSLYVGDLARAIESAGTNYSQRYTNASTAWSGCTFSDWLAVANPSKKRHRPSSGKSLSSRLCYQKHQGRRVIHLQDEAGECTRMDAAAFRVGEGEDESLVPVTVIGYQGLRHGVHLAHSFHSL
jgi:hypothetical protein